MKPKILSWTLVSLIVILIYLGILLIEFFGSAVLRSAIQLYGFPLDIYIFPLLSILIFLYAIRLRRWGVPLLPGLYTFLTMNTVPLLLSILLFFEPNGLRLTDSGTDFFTILSIFSPILGTLILLIIGFKKFFRFNEVAVSMPLRKEPLWSLMLGIIAFPASCVAVLFLLYANAF